MWKKLKQLVQGASKPAVVRTADPEELVDAALAIQSTEEIGDATSALDAHGVALVPEVARRLEQDQLARAPRMAAAIWLAHHATDECEPALDRALVETLHEALARDVFGVLLPASIDAVSRLPAERRDAIAARSFAEAGRSDQKFRLVKISRTDAMMEVVNTALAALEDRRIALGETAFRTSFEAGDVDLLLRHYPEGEPHATAYIAAFGALGDARTVPALVTALDSSYTRVRDTARRSLWKMQDVAEDAVLDLLTASRKGQRLGAAAVLEKWEINDHVRGAIQAALTKEKVAEVHEALLPLAPLEGDVNFRTMHDLRDSMPEDRRTAMADAVRRRLDGVAVDWASFAAHPEELVTIVARELEGAPTGADRCAAVLAEVLDVVGDCDLAPWASAWFARSIRSLYSKGRPLPWAQWQKSHLRFGQQGLLPIIDLLIEFGVEGDVELRRFAFEDYEPSDQQPRLLSHTYGHAHLKAAREMKHAGPTMTACVTPLLQDARKETRQAAAIALEAIGDASAEDALRARLKSERAKDAKQAIEAALTSLQLAALAEEVGAVDEMAPTAENHAELDARFASIGAKPKFDMVELPPMHWTSGAQLSEGAYRWLISALEQNDFSLPDPELEAVCAHLDDLDRKHLLDALHAGFDAEHREVRIGWVLFSTALLGNDDQVTSLGSGLDDMARFASSEQAFRRLEVLERHGSNAAIVWIDHWARRARSTGLKERARAALRRLAEKRSVTPEDLADLVFGDFGVDERGIRVFTFADRTVETKFDTSGEVGVLRDDGTLTTRFPSKRKDDDAEYERVRDEYRAWRKALKRALKGQADRFEWSMIWGRTWDLDTFLTNYGGHVVLRELACSILWLAHHGAHQTVVRLDNDLSFSNVEDEPFDGPIDAISVAHPVYFDGDGAAWQALFADYMLTSPFSQLDRPLAPVPELVGNELQFEEVDSEPLRGRLLRSGWERGYVEDGGIIYDLDREHPNGITSRVLLDPGMYVARDVFSDSQNVTLKFIRAENSIPLCEVPDCLLAEVCTEITGA